MQSKAADSERQPRSTGSSSTSTSTAYVAPSGSSAGGMVAGAGASSGPGPVVQAIPPPQAMSRAAQQEAALRQELAAGIIMPGPSSATSRHAGLPGTSAPTPVSLSVPRNLSVKQAAALPTDSAPPLFSSSLKAGGLQRGLKTQTGKLVAAGNPVVSKPSAKRNATSSTPSLAPGLKGTPSRSVRYSLPSRVDKPVRSSKVTGKHVVLPSESQLAPLPESEESSDGGDEEEDDEQAGLFMHPMLPPAIVARGASDQRSSPDQGCRPFKRPWRPIENAPGYPAPTLQKPSRHTRAPPRVPRTTGPAYHTFERMAPSTRISTPLPRLSSYAVGTDLHLPTLIGFLRREHGVKPRLYDECVYVQYFKPLLPGFGKANIRSAPEPRSGSPGAESRIERELIEREESGYVGSYFAQESEEGTEMDDDGYIKGGEGQSGEEIQQARREPSAGFALNEGPSRAEDARHFAYTSETDESDAERVNAGPSDPFRVVQPDATSSSKSQDSEADTFAGQASADSKTEPLYPSSPSSGTPTLLAASPPQPAAKHHASEDHQVEDHQGMLLPSPSTRHDGETSLATKKPRYPKRNMASHNHDTSANYLTTRSILEALQVGELVILPYGVVVMFNFTAAEERQIIEDMISTGCVRGVLRQDDVETEAFHFCYDPAIPAPRIFNDFFTFRTSNHLLKLSLAHAIAQSTKLSVFEESMQRTLELTSHIPRELASTGVLQLKRREALRMTGRLFKLRVDVNLTSNVLDTPELFWSEASLQALYTAIREYLEIDQRVENLNERLAVANDLLDIIHEHISNEAMSKITLIIIILILVACVVACGEISARLVLHARDARSRSAHVFC
ncbi:DUF155-domain-containing protein [Tilletiaria anomala UBC 951]|uniref:DUF155-domain-containing protein n=1 Tax=Tilletiaria anomala (strain ATCC 24038 / CBS 436.72 / UBC 951) TaxID=1037660 RepID=A0A066V9B8_TILAU|nr:DUF155-domain-containing protein [Tilletiaria anomala UBC 951]KDN38091.1 DUF155-domain-containing protein [Tilletiaria anomala UBC 951]